jgi:hypothetical protein
MLDKPFSQVVTDFLANPFDPNQDGKTSVVEWFAFLALVSVLTLAWGYVVNRFVIDQE